MGVITALEVQQRNKKRVSVFIDGAFAFGVTQDEALRLHVGQTLSADEIDLLIEEAAITVASDSAARYLAARPRSTKEVRDHLARKQIAPPVIDAAITKLEQLGYIDDQAFAAFWVRDREMFRPTSPRALRYELQQKGISRAIIDETLAELDADDAAYRAARKQVSRYRGSTQRAFRDRMGAHLGRRGFSFEVIRAVLRRLIDEIDAETPDFFTHDAPEEFPNDND